MLGRTCHANNEAWNDLVDRHMLKLEVNPTARGRLKVVFLIRRDYFFGVNAPGAEFVGLVARYKHIQRRTLGNVTRNVKTRWAESLGIDYSTSSDASGFHVQVGKSKD